MPLPGFENGYDAYIAAHCAPGAPGRLVSLAVSDKSWPVWETHPEGDEVVIVTKGRAEFIQELADGKRVRVVVGPNVIEPFTALYVTPAPGTTHRPRSSDDV